MKKEKATYFRQAGEKNTEEALGAALDRLNSGDIRYAVVASSTGMTAFKAADRFKSINDLNLIAVALSAGKNPAKDKEWDANVEELERANVTPYRAIHALSGVERAVKSRWGTAGPVLMIADTLRLLSEGTKVGVEVAVMAADAGLIPIGEKVLTVAGSSKGADTCLVVKAAGSSNFYDFAIQEIVCKPYSEGVKHEAR